jgi:ATP-binding protein involved in chromosome partitioning
MKNFCEEIEMAIREGQNQGISPQRDQETQKQSQEQVQLLERMGRIKHKILVLSGKGGVGKSTVAVNLASSLAAAGKSVGLLDVDIHGPSIPTLLNLEGRPLSGTGEEFLPVELENHLKIISMGLLLRDPDDAVIWRGPMKAKMIQQFIRDVEWGDLDFLIVDAPPGTGDEPLSVVQLIEDADGAIIVTTPQQVAISDVRKAITFCRQLDLPVLGVLENMSGFICPHCGEGIDIFNRGGGEAMAEDMNVPFLGRIPLDPDIVRAGDEGTPFTQAFADSETAKAFGKAIGSILKCLE